MIRNVLQINASTPFLIGVPNSQVSREWIRLLNSIVALVGAFESDDFQTEFFTNRFTSRTTTNLSDAIATVRTDHMMLMSQRSIISSMSQRIAELEMRLPPARSTISVFPSSDSSIMVLPSRLSSTAMTFAISDDTATNATMYPIFANGVNGNRSLKASSTGWTFNPSTGRMTSTQLVATAGFGCNGAAPQTAYASGGAAPAGGVGTAAGGWDTAVNRDAAITLINNMRAALVANGIMS